MLSSNVDQMERRGLIRSESPPGVELEERRTGGSCSGRPWDCGKPAASGLPCCTKETK